MQQLKGEAVGATYIISNYICGNNGSHSDSEQAAGCRDSSFIVVGAAIE